MLFLVLSCWTQKGWQDRCPRFIDLAWVFSSSTPEGERDRASLVYSWLVLVVSFSSDLRNDKPVQKGRMPLLWKSKQVLSWCLVFVIVQSAFGTGTIVQLVTCDCVAIELLEEIKHVRFIVDVEWDHVFISTLNQILFRFAAHPLQPDQQSFTNYLQKI